MRYQQCQTRALTLIKLYFSLKVTSLYNRISASVNPVADQTLLQQSKPLNVRMLDVQNRLMTINLKCRSSKKLQRILFELEHRALTHTSYVSSINSRFDLLILVFTLIYCPIVIRHTHP